MPLANQTLYLTKTGTEYFVTPLSTTTGDALKIRGNRTDTSPSITLQGNSQLIINGGTSIRLIVSGVEPCKISHSGTEFMIEEIRDGEDIYLKTTGVGVIKFGTYTAGAALASDGYITIKDAGGVTRKLMVQA